jgi:transglutaminase-like putative cysteine protease
MNHIEKWLKSTPTFDCGNKSIEEKAKDITKGYEEASDKARSLFYFVRDKIKYNLYSPLDAMEYYQASETLKRGHGNCIQKAIVLTTLARVAGIPARLRLADFINHRATEDALELTGTNLFLYHGYTELHLDGKWVKATPALDIQTCGEHRFIPVEFDGKHHAMFPSHDLDGNKHIEYVRDHGYVEELPLDKISADWARLYGTHSRDRFNNSAAANKIKGKATG